MKKNNYSTYLILGLVVIAAIIVYVTSVNKSAEQLDEQTEIIEYSSEETQANFNGTIIYANSLEQQTDIYSYKLSESNANKVYTDSDEEQKIKSLGSITNNADILAFLTTQYDQFIGNLNLISTSGSGEINNLISDFASSGTPLISPDGSKLAYTQFSNAEFDFGYKLIVSNSDGTAKFEIDADGTELTIYSWNKDSDKICYSKGSTEGDYKLYTAEINSNQVEELTTIDGIVMGLDWGNNNTFAVAIQPEGEPLNNTEIFKFTLQNTKPTQVTSDGFYSGFPILSPESENIAFATLDYPEGTKGEFTSGQINLINIDGNNLTKLGDGNHVLGWTN